MRLAFSTLGCPGASLDHVLELAKGNDMSGLELRAADEEFTNTGLTAAQRRGLRVPEQLAVVGYNDIPLARRLRLTTIHVPMHDFGRESARILLQQVASGSPSGERVIFEPEIVVRETTISRD